ncbi:MAG TPA: nuclear transport factor 2 family protein [Candidatus Binatia bacterium]|nr:nuclear transport factor 2 family protein [Candidatus Binatia bacterium]
MPTHAEAAALFERRRLAWLAGDLDGYLALWHPDVVFASPVHDPPICGREAYAAVVRRSYAALRPLRFDVARLAVAGAAVLAEWSILVERRADARPVGWRGMSACEIEGGLIRDWREYWNPADLAALRA